MLDTQMVEAELDETLRTNPSLIHEVLGSYLEDPVVAPVAQRWSQANNARLSAIQAHRKLREVFGWDDFL